MIIPEDKQTHMDQWRAAIEAMDLEHLRQATMVTEDLFYERNRLLMSIPECPVHGPGCVPHALDWIEAQKAKP